ncbi:hypothetical protein Csa_002334 [Cucumis sativus]|uniref:Uncharacterized protein n=1 Tax=Cucumis sativus TaxID=3659 RepID=A0A0A0LAM0_CUCSA|nr:hypothetical protein Csa_002334 [Cucumis sativus]
MSQRPSRHQRRPSQGVFMPADYLSDPPPPVGPGSTVESGGPHSSTLLTRPTQQSRSADPVAARPPAPPAVANNDAPNPAS